MSMSASVSPEAPTATKTNPAPLVSLKGITKRFPAVVANDRVDLDIFAGEVHAILGENGSGKSTLMKVLYGYYQPDAGQVFFQGEPVILKSPQDARRLRIGMVFQNFTLVPAFTVAENVALFLPELKLRLDLKDDRPQDPRSLQEVRSGYRPQCLRLAVVDGRAAEDRVDQTSPGKCARLDLRRTDKRPCAA